MATIVVGLDGSPESKAALAWALEDARLRGATLRVVTAWTAPDAYVGDTPAPMRPELEEALRGVGDRVIEDALAEVLKGSDAAVPIERCVVPAPPAGALLAAAADADLLVVGSRGLGGFAGLLLGSVSQQVAHHAPCPVAIVRSRRAGTKNGRVVVGIDGSEASKAALRWADEEARLRRARLAVVHAWTPRLAVGPGLMPMPLPVETVEDDVEAFVGAMVADALGGDRAPGVEHVVVQGAASLALVDSVTPGDLLVVGSRGHGGFAELLLGSVSQQVAHHAPCPVVIVRERV